jgi:predicted O-methyltransferase YrrM
VELGPNRPASDEEASRDMGYATWPLRRDGFQPDLVFVDGRRRVDCVTVALDVLAMDGLIVLHDAHRPNYQAGLKRQDACEEPYTCYLRKYDAALITRRPLRVVFDQDEG